MHGNPSAATPGMGGTDRSPDLRGDPRTSPPRPRRLRRQLLRRRDPPGCVVRSTSRCSMLPTRPTSAPSAADQGGRHADAPSGLRRSTLRRSWPAPGPGGARSPQVEREPGRLPAASSARPQARRACGRRRRIAVRRRRRDRRGHPFVEPVPPPCPVCANDFRGPASPVSPGCRPAARSTPCPRISELPVTSEDDVRAAVETCPYALAGEDDS